MESAEGKYIYFCNDTIFILYKYIYIYNLILKGLLNVKAKNAYFERMQQINHNRYFTEIMRTGMNNSIVECCP